MNLLFTRLGIEPKIFELLIRRSTVELRVMTIFPIFLRVAKGEEYGLDEIIHFK